MVVAKHLRLNRLLKTASAVAALGLVLTLALPYATMAQEAASLKRLNGSVVLTGQANTVAPEGAETIGITLSRVTVANGLPQMKAQDDAYVARLTRGRVPLSEIFDATADLQAAYADAGFVLTRVVLASQTLRDSGMLRVDIVNGYVEAVRTDGLPENIRGRIEGLTNPLVNRRDLTRGELERQLLLAGEVPGTALNAALEQGQARGAAVIALEPEYRLVTGFAGAGNPYSSDLGTVDLNFGMELNSALGLGETVYFRGSGTPSGFFSSDPRLRTLSVGGVVPIGLQGGFANLEWTTNNSFRDNIFNPARTDFERASLRYIYPFIKSQSLSVTAQIALDLTKDEQELDFGGFVIPLYEDQLTVLRAGVSANSTADDASVTTGNLTFSRGLDTLGARSVDETFVFPFISLSRFGADATFSKLAGSVSHSRKLSDLFTLSVNGRFQYAFGDALLTSEQFSLVGPHELSTFDSGELKGDSGWLVRAELSSMLDQSLGQLPVTIKPYVFAGYGVAKLKFPTFFEQARTEATVYGIGVDLFLKTDSNFRSAALRIEYGKGERDDGFPDENRFSISGSIRF